jgi:hypothetical protein
MESAWERVKDLFDRALALPVEQRSTFAADACGDDAALPIRDREAPGRA